MNEYKNRYPVMLEKDMEIIFRRAVQRATRYLLKRLKPMLTKKVGMDAEDDLIPPIDNQEFNNLLNDAEENKFLTGKTVIIGAYVISAADWTAINRVLKGAQRQSEAAFQKAQEDLETRMKRDNKTFAKSMKKKGLELSITSTKLSEKPFSPVMDNIIKQSAERAAMLISTAPMNAIKRVEQVVREGVTTGWTQKKLSKELIDATGAEESRAEFWARDQVGKIVGDIEKTQQTEAGFPGFIWVTQLDGRVRDAHAELHGKFFTWQDGADGLYPGSDYNCRCSASPATSEGDELSQEEIDRDLRISEKYKKQME